MNKQKSVRSVQIDVHDALNAICAYGKGRCWYCDTKLPHAKRAIREGWDVRRVEEKPVASIILVCPGCVAKNRRARASTAAGPGFHPIAAPSDDAGARRRAPLTGT